ncbi:uncharacterized protein LOC110810505 [Carica papaya]|uniref:uncharacterized protein LOC110810505 n=1 Tax=Carica papaya TaxID=3649 RepID=UPI000B8C6E79|nr:uncharacterized protein LOC110810505 [Carica papaya]
MAAALPNKAGSQIPSRQNHSARNSEIGNPIRRSFSGNPFAKPSVVPTARGFNSINTPANSPSEFHRRHSMGRESSSSFCDLEDKENGKDANLKAARVRSPAAPKGSKNFMSPTISAASKMNASPRKKILSERNDAPVRHSVSFSDVTTIIMEDNKIQKKLVEMDSHEQTIMDMDFKETMKNDEAVSQKDQHDSAAETMKINEAAVMEDELLVFQTSQQEDSVAESDDADPSFKISPGPSASYSSSMVAPLDADPKMPPYDPKTNYLSPRPQFLNYRPNPRIMLYLDSKREGSRLEENFAFESSSDTEVTGEEETQSEDSLKQSEDVSSETSEPDSMSNADMLLQGVEAKAVLSKPRLFTRSKFIALVLIMVVGWFSLSVTDSPVVQPLLRDLTLYEFYVPPEATNFAKASFYELSQKFRLWSANCLSHIYKLVSRLGGVHELAPLQYANLTGFLKDCSIDGFPHRKFDLGLLKPLRERKVDNEVVDDKSRPLIEADETIDEVDEGMNHDLGFEAEGNSEVVCEEHHDSSKHEENQQDIGAEVIENGDSSEVDKRLVEREAKQSEMMFEFDSSEDEKKLERVEWACVVAEVDVDAKQSDAHTNNEQLSIMVETEVIKPDSSEGEKNFNSNAEPESDFEAREFTALADSEQVRVMELSEQPLQLEPSEAGKPEIENKMNFITEAESTGVNNDPEIFVFDVADENSQGAETMDSATKRSENELKSMHYVLPISLLVLSLIAAIAFMSGKKSKASIPSAAVTTKVDCNTTSMTAEQLIQERFSSLNWPTEVDMLGESCPSGMSSYQSSFCSQKESSEAESQERQSSRRNHKRESLASSDFSTGSPSYGSFTTYEKIAIKSGQGEATTPVRRSSRLSRKQVTSSR